MEHIVELLKFVLSWSFTPVSSSRLPLSQHIVSPHVSNLVAVFSCHDVWCLCRWSQVELLTFLQLIFVVNIVSIFYSVNKFLGMLTGGLTSYRQSVLCSITLAC